MPYVEVEDSSKAGFHLELDNRVPPSAIVGQVDTDADLPALADVLIGAMFFVRGPTAHVVVAITTSDDETIATSWHTV